VHEVSNDIKSDEHVPFLKDLKIQPYQRLLTCKHTYGRSLWAVRLCAVADTINVTLLNVTYPFIVTPGAHPVRYYTLILILPKSTDILYYFHSLTFRIPSSPLARLISQPPNTFLP
jgi:hypothetical protein